MGFPQVVYLKGSEILVLPDAASWEGTVFYVYHSGLSDNLPVCVDEHAYIPRDHLGPDLILYKQQGGDIIDGVFSWFWSFDRAGQRPCSRKQ